MLALLIVGAALALPCDDAANDGDVNWSGLKHDSFEASYRSPFGAVPAGSGAVTLRLRSCAQDLTGVRVRVWDEVAMSESWHDMAWDRSEDDEALGPVDLWALELPVPDSPGRLFYLFEIADGHPVRPRRRPRP